jgi:pyruvate ferredoxin oxidoreductase beta subunit
LRKAKEIEGTKYIHLLAPCPTGWRYDSSKTIELGRLAVTTGLWVLYEIENGKFKLNSPSDRLIDQTKRKPVKEYFALQGRFRGLSTDDVGRVQKWLDEDWGQYERLAAAPDLALFVKP